MDVSSREKVTRNGKSLATGRTVPEMNHNNHENMENHKISVPGDLSSTPKKTVSEHENEANELSQSSQRKKGRPRKTEKMVRGSSRILRSRSQEKPKISESVVVPSQSAESKEKKRKKINKDQINKDQNNEFSKIKSHLRYLLSRMSYEQNFIDAYVGEGWKGQSLEKIKPEKEIERAKSYINRYKLKIRDLFQRIDTSCEEGKFPESLYDSEGLIDSEDIFCSKCGQTEVRLDNDIILCDGACERGFHQFCLVPPLLKEQVPPGDEGWLCPACDCKVDCFDLLNDAQGTNLSINDDWEKVFPETAASGNNLDDSGLLSDDSGDDDYNPDGPQVEDEADAEDSSSDESDFSSASEDLGAIANNEEFLGFPSDDSEDDDFNPDKADSDEEAKEKSSDSDFTSDFDDLGDIKNEDTSAEVKEPVIPENDEEIPKTNMEDDDFAPITAKRHVERLDYKKLHDETYGDISSDSSDEEFIDSEAPKKRKNTKRAKDIESNKKQKESESTPVKETSEKQDIEGTSSSPAIKKGSSDKNGTKSSSKRLGEAATKRLYESFKENRYPDPNVRDNLAKELNLTHTQVRKWFENARWSFNHPEGRSKAVKSSPKPAEVIVPKQATEENKANLTTPKSGKKKSKADHQASPMDSSNQTTRRSSRNQAKSS